MIGEENTINVINISMNIQMNVSTKTSNMKGRTANKKNIISAIIMLIPTPDIQCTIVQNIAKNIPTISPIINATHMLNGKQGNNTILTI